MSEVKNQDLTVGQEATYSYGFDITHQIAVNGGDRFNPSGTSLSVYNNITEGWDGDHLEVRVFEYDRETLGNMTDQMSKTMQSSSGTLTFTTKSSGYYYSVELWKTQNNTHYIGNGSVTY